MYNTSSNTKQLQVIPGAGRTRHHRNRENLLFSPSTVENFTGHGIEAPSLNSPITLWCYDQDIIHFQTVFKMTSWPQSQPKIDVTRCRLRKDKPGTSNRTILRPGPAWVGDQDRIGGKLGDTCHTLGALQPSYTCCSSCRGYLSSELVVRKQCNVDVLFNVTENK